MESCNRTEPTDRILLFLIAAALGTFALAFVSSGAWRSTTGTLEQMLSTVTVRQLLTVLLLCAVPPVWARLAYRISPWILLVLAVFAFGAGLIVTADPTDALYTALLCAIPGVGLYGLQRMKLSNFRTVIYASFVNLAALFVFVCLRERIRSGDAYASYKQTVGLFGEVLNRLAVSADPTGETGLAAEAELVVKMLRVNADAYCAAILLIPSMAAALFGVLLSHLFNRHGGAALMKLPPFSEWRCERRYVIAAGVFLFATMLLGMFGWHTASALSGAAAVMWRVPCGLGGLCTVRRFGSRFGRNGIFWITIILLILLPPATGVVLTLLGFLSALRNPTNAKENGGRK